MKNKARKAIGTASLAAMLAASAMGAGPAGAHEPPGNAHGHKAQHGQQMQKNRGQAKTVQLRANLTQLNESGASGTATAVVRNQKIREITVSMQGLTPDAPHAQHIHYGDDARNECPNLFDDDVNNDGIINTIEGLPAYGPIVVSLTTTGDTTPSSALDVTRFPVAENGMFNYSRSNIEFTSVAGTGYGGAGGTGTAKQIADAIRMGEGVVVIHGVDENGNGRYDGPASTLDPSLPQEATLPAACGILK